MAGMREELDRALRRALRGADHCHGIVTRDGDQDACGKPPVAIIDARAAEDGCYWPACAYHANRYGAGRCVPLRDLLAAARQTPAEWAAGLADDKALVRDVAYAYAEGEATYAARTVRHVLRALGVALAEREAQR